MCSCRLTGAVRVGYGVLCSIDGVSLQMEGDPRGEKVIRMPCGLLCLVPDLIGMGFGGILIGRLSNHGLKTPLPMSERSSTAQNYRCFSYTTSSTILSACASLVSGSCSSLSISLQLLRDIKPFPSSSRSHSPTGRPSQTRCCASGNPSSPA